MWRSSAGEGRRVEGREEKMEGEEEEVVEETL